MIALGSILASSVIIDTSERKGYSSIFGIKDRFTVYLSNSFCVSVDMIELGYWSIRGAIAPIQYVCEYLGVEYRIRRYFQGRLFDSFLYRVRFCT